MLNSFELRKALISKRKDFFSINEDGLTIDVKPYSLTCAEIVKNTVNIIKKLNAKTVMLYLPMNGEVDITGITELPLRFYVPVTHGVEIKPAEYNADQKLIKVKFGVSVPECPIYTDKHSLDLVLVPAVAVDREKNRMGYGKGCYDRFLADMDCVKAAVCFDFQVTDSLNTQPHDVKMDYIITESGCF